MQDNDTPHDVLKRIAAAVAKAGSVHRMQILVAMHEKRQLSATRFVSGYDTPLEVGAASYHFRKLAEIELTVLAKEVPRRGAVENYYKLTADGRRVVEAFAEAIEAS